MGGNGSYGLCVLGKGVRGVSFLASCTCGRPRPSD